MRVLEGTESWVLRRALAEGQGLESRDQKKDLGNRVYLYCIIYV